MTVFLQGLNLSSAAVIELLGETFGDRLVSDRFSAFNHLPVEQSKLCLCHRLALLVPQLYAPQWVFDQRHQTSVISGYSAMGINPLGENGVKLPAADE